MRRLTVRCRALVAFCFLFVGAAGLAAQQAPAPQLLRQDLRGRGLQSPTELDQQRAEDTQAELRKLLENYPPALARVLRLDSSLMTNAAYLAPYPALATFLQRHPEVPRYPDYFLSFVRQTTSFEQPMDPEAQVRVEAVRMWRDVMNGLMFLSGFLAIVLTLSWLIRAFVSHRRWLRATRVQSDVHGKLMERFHSNEELMAYVQSPAGRHFLEGLPVAVDPVTTPGPAAPFGRILWSVQAGLVLACAGIGLLSIRGYIVEEAAEMMLLFGTLGVAVGVGFALAAAASYMLSARLGLLEAARDTAANRT
jgi:hypothetical protein